MDESPAGKRTAHAAHAAHAAQAFQAILKENRQRLIW
jgi:hypothetical protein